MQVCACAAFRGLRLKTLKGSFQKLTKQLPSAVLLSLHLCASFVFFFVHSLLHKMQATGAIIPTVQVHTRQAFGYDGEATGERSAHPLHKAISSFV